MNGKEKLLFALFNLKSFTQTAGNQVKYDEQMVNWNIMANFRLSNNTSDSMVGAVNSWVTFSSDLQSRESSQIRSNDKLRFIQ